MCPLFLNGLGYVSNGNCISKRKHGNINKKKMNMFNVCFELM